MAQGVLSGAATSTGAKSAYICPLGKPINAILRGAAITGYLEHSFDDGTTWDEVSKNSDGATAEYTASATDSKSVTVEPYERAGVQLRWNISTAATGGEWEFNA